jgi:predicted ATPase
MTSFRPNHKIFNGFARIKKKNLQKFLEKIKFYENHRDDSDSEKSPFSAVSNVFAPLPGTTTELLKDGGPSLVNALNEMIQQSLDQRDTT